MLVMTTSRTRIACGRDDGDMACDGERRRGREEPPTAMDTCRGLTRRAGRRATPQSEHRHQRGPVRPEQERGGGGRHEPDRPELEQQGESDRREDGEDDHGNESAIAANGGDRLPHVVGQRGALGRLVDPRLPEREVRDDRRDREGDRDEVHQPGAGQHGEPSTHERTDDEGSALRAWTRPSWRSKSSPEPVSSRTVS